MSPQIEVCKNLDYEIGEIAPRYFLKVDLGDIVPGRSACLPVYWKPNSLHPLLKEIYSVEIAGYKIEKGNLQMLLGAVNEAIELLKGQDTLPYYSLIIPTGTRFPIYLKGDKLTIEINERLITGSDIGEVFEKCTNYLLSKKIISSEAEVTLGLFLWADLSLYLTAMVIRDARKRVWLPIFSHKDFVGIRSLIFDVVNKPSQRFEISELAKLWYAVNSFLNQKHSFSPNMVLYADRVDDFFWKELKKTLLSTEASLRYYSEGKRNIIPVYKIDNILLGAERPRIYVGEDLEKLRSNVTRILNELGIVSGSASVELEQIRRESA